MDAGGRRRVPTPRGPAAGPLSAKPRRATKESAPAKRVLSPTGT